MVEPQIKNTPPAHGAPGGLTAAQRKANLRLGLTLASVALLLGLGFFLKIWLFGR